MKKFLITAVAFGCISLASCSSNNKGSEQRDSTKVNDTVGAQAPGDSVRLADSAVNRADHVNVDTAKNK